ncbi:MAG: alpha/beta hydrolase [Cytophagales bacterium]|nr:MAG: alpha/beta hydrolase [Cytophagales bacterium]
MKTDIFLKNNITIHNDNEGKKPMLFVHGYGCDQHMWRHVVPAFQDQFKIILIDLVGSGKSDWNAYDYEKYSHLQAHADDIIAICEALALSNTTLVCHSVSCMIGLLAAIKKPNYFESVLMITPSPCYINKENYIGGFSQTDIDDLLENLDSNYLGWSSAIAPVIMGNSERPELANELENSFCQNDPKIAKHFARVTFLGDNRQDLAKMTVPSLVIQCQQDVIAPIEVGRYLETHLPFTTLHIINANGHCPHLSHPEETINAMQNFLNQKSHD